MDVPRGGDSPMSVYYASCERVAPGVHCCTSCHEDEDLGYPLSTVTVDGEEISVCCAVLLTPIEEVERVNRRYP